LTAAKLCSLNSKYSISLWVGNWSLVTQFFNNWYNQLLWILQESWTATQSKRVALPWQISSGHTNLIKWNKYIIWQYWIYTINISTWVWYWAMLWKSISATSMLVTIPIDTL
jgi:hypothetical protein